jgi:hypothetical protein
VRLQPFQLRPSSGHATTRHLPSESKPTRHKIKGFFIDFSFFLRFRKNWPGVLRYIWRLIQYPRPEDVKGDFEPRVNGLTAEALRAGEGAESQPDVISIIARDIASVDHSQGESGVSTNQPTGPKSLWLKILLLSH